MTYVAVALLLGLVILVREPGHFLAAKAVGLPLARFPPGFGPALCSRTWGGTRCGLSAVPFGGDALLALPPLDGGKIVCDVHVRCRAGLARYSVPVSACGWLALMALMPYATIRDVCRSLA
jgi:membrane-associated protease RseP (regulator of RpoE activity)